MRKLKRYYLNHWIWIVWTLWNLELIATNKWWGKNLDLRDSYIYVVQDHIWGLKAEIELGRFGEDFNYTHTYILNGGANPRLPVADNIKIKADRDRRQKKCCVPVLSVEEASAITTSTLSQKVAAAARPLQRAARGAGRGESRIGNEKGGEEDCAVVWHQDQSAGCKLQVNKMGRNNINESNGRSP